MSQITIFNYDRPSAEGYGIPYTPVDLGDPRIGGMVCRVEPEKTSKPHNHYEREAFLILSGSGVIQAGQDRAGLAKGQCVLIPPFVDHRIENPGPDILEFLSIYWIGDGNQDSS